MACRQQRCRGAQGTDEASAGGPFKLDSFCWLRLLHLPAGLAAAAGTGAACAAGAARGEPAAPLGAVDAAAPPAAAALGEATPACRCLPSSHSRLPSRLMERCRRVGALSSGTLSWRKASSPTKQIWEGRGQWQRGHRVEGRAG